MIIVKICNKILILGLSFSMVCAGSMNKAHASGPAWYKQGDINNSSVIDITDLSYMNLFLDGSKVTAHDRMTERLDVDNNSVIDYRDADKILDIISHPQISDIISYTNNASLIESAHSVQYKKITLSNNSAYLSYYTLNAANPISEATSSLQLLNNSEEISLASASNESGIARIYVNIGNETRTVTGFVVDDNVILTAASNLCEKVSGNTWRYATSVSCDIYTMSGTRVQSRYNAAAYHIPNSFTTATDNTGYNYALIKLGETVDLSDYKMDLGVPTTDFSGNVKTTSENRVNIPSSVHALYGQKVHGSFINYSGSLGSVSYGSPVFVEKDSQITVIGIASKYVEGIPNFNRAVRINQDILRFVYSNSNL